MCLQLRVLLGHTYDKAKTIITNMSYDKMPKQIFRRAVVGNQSQSSTTATATATTRTGTATSTTIIFVS